MNGKCDFCAHQGRNRFKHFIPYCTEPTICVEHECRTAYLNGSIKAVNQVPMGDAKDICKANNWLFYKERNGNGGKL